VAGRQDDALDWLIPGHEPLKPAPERPRPRPQGGKIAATLQRPLIRNAEMVAAGAGMCIAFHQFLRQSRGTKDCVRRALEAGIPTYLVDSKEAQPRRLRAGDARLR